MAIVKINHLNRILDLIKAIQKKGIAQISVLLFCTITIYNKNTKAHKKTL